MDKAPPKTAKQQADRAAEASLNAALSDLEEILVHRQGSSVGSATDPAAASTPAKHAQRAQGPAPRSPDAARERGAGHDAQYTIPLLHDVVVPGADVAMVKPSLEGRPADPAPGGDQTDDACLKLLERLSNEIEVIVQARIEAAVQEAASEIRAEIRNHLEIVLPEIIDELRELTRERR